MTICVSVKIAEGLVFAADSAVMLQQATMVGNQAQVGIIQNFNYANKVTQVKDYPIGVMSWGLGSIGERSIQSLIMEFEHDYPSTSDNKGYHVEKVATELIDFIRQRYDNVYPASQSQPLPPDHRKLGFIIGGYSSKEFFAEQYTFSFPDSTALEHVRPNKSDFGVNWYGAVDALVRLIKGYDLASLEALVQRGVDKDILRKWLDENISELPIIFQGMPIQDAIDFAEYCVQVVIGRYRFGPGPALCGGAIDIAVIRPLSYKWARRKQWAIKD